MKQKRINNTSATIPTTSTIISPAFYGDQGSRRISLLLKNTSTSGEKISLGINTNAIDGSGIVLNAGESITFSQDGGYMPPQDFIAAIADVATATLAIYEEVEMEV